MSVRRSPIIFPLLLAAYPILHLYEANIQQVPLPEVFLPLAAVLVIFGTLFLALRAIVRDAITAGFLVCALAIFVLYYGHIYEAVVRIAMGLGLLGYFGGIRTWHHYLLPLWLGLVGAAAFIVVRQRSRLPGVIPYLNVVTAVLVVMPLAGIAVQSYSMSRADTNDVCGDMEDVHPVASEPLPDIYYIILDGYARDDILLDYFGLDNSSFTDGLSARGFYVAAESRSNYPATFLSLASSLNMTYLNELSDDPIVSLSEGMRPFNMIRNNRVWCVLDSLGYTYVHISSGYTLTDFNGLADVNYRYSLLTEFTELCLETTVLSPVTDRLFAENTRERVLYSFDRLHEIPDMEEPTYVFAHLVIPHGSPTVPSGIGPPERNLEEYVEKVLFVNSRVETLVDDILAHSDTPPIIILQADHGTTFTQREWMSEDIASMGLPEEALTRERLAILNAYYLPGDGARRLYPSITPVNTFRLICDTYFGTDFGLLEDRSYFGSYEPPYEFFLIPD